MSIADRVKQTLDAKEWAAFTLAGGYAQGYNGETVRFPVGAVERDTRNDQGRVTLMRLRYADNSTLTYTYRNERYSLAVK